MRFISNMCVHFMVCSSRCALQPALPDRDSWPSPPAAQRGGRPRDGRGRDREGPSSLPLFASFLVSSPVPRSFHEPPLLASHFNFSSFCSFFVSAPPSLPPSLPLPTTPIFPPNLSLSHSLFLSLTRSLALLPRARHDPGPGPGSSPLRCTATQ